MKPARKREPLTRAELAKTCGVAKSTVRRWEAKGIITPIKNEKRVHLFDIDEAADVIGDRPIVRLDQARPYVPSVADAGGDVAAQIFERLDRGAQPNEIVCELRIHPDIVEGFFERWKRWRKAIVFTQEAIWGLVDVLRISPPPRNPSELIEGARHAIAKLKASAQCRSCKKSRAKICRRCNLEPARRHEDDLRQRLGLPPRPPRPVIVSSTPTDDGSEEILDEEDDES